MVPAQTTKRSGAALAAALALGLFLPAGPLAAAAEPVEDQPPKIASPLAAYLAGLSATRANDLSVATDYMLLALSGDPGNLALVQPVFLLAAAEGRHESAEKLALQLIEREPDNVVARTVLAIKAVVREDWQAAEEHFSHYPARGVASVLGPLLSGWVAFAAGNLEEGLTRVQGLGEESGLGLLAHMHSALMLDLAGENERAEAAYEKALSSSEHPTMRLAWLTGNFFERAAKPDKAKAVYEQFLRGSRNASMADIVMRRLADGEAPDSEVGSPADGLAEVLFNIASLLSQEQAEDLALMGLHQALRLKPDYPVASLLLGEIQQRQGRGRAAIETYRSISQTSPFAWLVRLRTAELLQDMKRIDEALAELDHLAQERPDQFEPLFRKGNLLRAEEKFAAAVEAYDAAVERVSAIKPQHWTLLYYRGIALERSKQWERAEADFLKALELQPDQPFVMNYLAYSWIEAKIHLDEAKAMLVRAVELRPDDGYIVDSLGWVYYRLGEFENAVTYLEMAVELRPQDPVINDHLGDAFWRIGRRAEARFQWRRALSLEPEEDQVPLIEDKIEKGMADKSDEDLSDT